MKPSNPDADTAATLYLDRKGHITRFSSENLTHYHTLGLIGFLFRLLFSTTIRCLSDGATTTGSLGPDGEEHVFEVCKIHQRSDTPGAYE